MNISKKEIEEAYIKYACDELTHNTMTMGEFTRKIETDEEFYKRFFEDSFPNMFKMPHIKYISEIQSKSKEERTLYYLGGESEENHSRLTVGKVYEIRTASYSPSADLERVSVWICSDDENKGKVCQINPINFGTFADIRDRKINQIIN
jgi:hypothetical protein